MDKWTGQGILPAMRLLLTYLAFGLLALASAAGPPNVIVIYTDDHGWPDIGPAGVYGDLKTPHLDALAASGIYASNGYSSAPQCVPSRAGLLTGKYQNRFGVESNAHGLAGFDAELTVAERLKKVGYTTCQVGKWHLGPGTRIGEHGFDYFYNKNRNAPGPANFDREGNKIAVRDLPQTTYHIDDCSDMARAFIRKHKDGPFFLYLAYRAPHVPLDAPKKYLDRFPGEMPERRRQALAMISAMDDGVGAIVAELKELGLTDKTLIFYIGDNGAPLKIHKHDAPGGGPGWDGSLNKPMNGEKGMLSEGGMRVPYLISWPGTLPAGKTYAHPVISLDATATALHLAGINEPSLDGINLVPHLQNGTAPQRVLTWRWLAQAAIREGKWKLLIGGQRRYLFDLDQDPGELRNLISAHPELARRLEEQLVSWSNGLQPAGLDTKGMSTVWELYYDFYLDGKPAPPLRSNVAPPAAGQGAICRGGSTRMQDGALVVTPGPDSKNGPFLVRNGLKLDGPFTATIRIRSGEGGPVGISWRLDGQKDFVPGQVVSTTAEVSPDWQTVTLDVPAKGTTIHLRLLLPNHPVSVSAITFKDAGTSTTWNPAKT